MKIQKQQGFTLIELVMVIVVLGILAAVALPKFADLKTDAKVASAQGVFGAVNAAIAIVHSKALVSGVTAGTVAMETGTVAVTAGYPTDSAALLTAMAPGFPGLGTATCGTTYTGGATATLDTSGC